MAFISEAADRAFPRNAPRSAVDLPTEDRNLAAEIRSKAEQARGAVSRLSHEAQWMTNIAYAMGYDGLFYDVGSRQYQSITGGSGAPKRNRVHENLILPSLQNRNARLLKNPPRWEIAPEDETEEAKEKARKAYQVLLQLFEEAGYYETRIHTRMWTQLCGHSWVKVGYDSMAGRPMFDPETGEFMGFRGQTTATAVSALEVLPDPLATRFCDLTYLVHCKVRKLTYFRDRYPLGYLVKEESPWLQNVQYLLRVNALSSNGPQSSSTMEQMKDAAIELGYYEAPTMRYPRGRLIITSNGVVLTKRELPVGEIPFAKFDDIVMPGKLYPESVVTHARPLQDQYNVTLQRRADWTRKLLAGKYMASKDHGLHQEALDDRSGEVVEYNETPGAPPPQAIQVPTIPQYAYTESDLLKNATYDQFGLGQASRGVLPSGSIPAIGLQLLVEQDETRMGIEIEQHEHAEAQVGRLMLKYERKFVKVPKQLKRKFNSAYVFEDYVGDDLPDEPDVRVIRGSTAYSVKAIRNQEIINAWQQGLLGNPQDPAVIQQVMGKLEFGENQDLWKSYNLDMQVAQREIGAILRGEVPELNQLDNHMLIIQELNSFRKQNAETLSGEQKKILDGVIALHGEMQAHLQNPQLTIEKQNLAQGLMPDGTDPNIASEAQARDAELQSVESDAKAAVEASNISMGA